jgi:TDG/mug DNA glycosylase family protein
LGDEIVTGMGLIGYQQRSFWMGAPVLTLADVWPDQPSAVIVGLNPALSSVAAGHYYQGRAGRLQLLRLARAGLFVPPNVGSYFEESAVSAGVGFTDIVKRPTRGEGGVTAAEIDYGKALLGKALADRSVELVICVFRQPTKALLGATGAPGFQSRRTAWGARVFRMPGPYEKTERVAEAMSSLSAAL